MKIKIENVNVYITKAPSDEERDSDVINYTPIEKALGWENKTPEEIDALIDRMTEGIHDGLKSVYNEGTGKNRIETDDEPRESH